MADFYIRSWDPDSTYPPNPQEGDVCYTITLDQSWAPVAGVKNDNLLKTEIYTNGEWVEQGGGGGGGEMKTATVTVSGLGDPLAINSTIIIGDVIISEAVIENGEYTVPLGENGCLWALREEATVAVTGDIAFDSEEGVFTITGDGTITFS